MNKNSIENFSSFSWNEENNTNKYSNNKKFGSYKIVCAYIRVHNADIAFKIRIRLMILQQNTLFYFFICFFFTYRARESEHMRVAIFVCSSTYTQRRYFCVILSTNVHINDIGCHSVNERTTPQHNEMKGKPAEFVKWRDEKRRESCVICHKWHCSWKTGMNAIKYTITLTYNLD